MTNVQYFANHNNLEGVMANAGIWSSVKYTLTNDDCVIRALIPEQLLENGLIPKTILTLICLPSRANKLVLKLKYGVLVEYEYADVIVNKINVAI